MNGIIEEWFVYEESFWAFSEMNDLCADDPLLAWEITLDLIDGADNDREIGAIAAGPLETLFASTPTSFGRISGRRLIRTHASSRP